MCHQFETIPAAIVQEIAAQIESKAFVDVDYATTSLETAGVHYAYPGSEVAVLVRNGQDALAMRTLTWGFEVSWQKQLVFNTRIESIAKSDSMWKSAFQSGRCVIPVTAFFETHRSETLRNAQTGRKVKRRYRFALEDADIFFLAGISENGRFSVVTTEPNNSVAPIHNRMPIALRQSEVNDWLGADYAKLADRRRISLLAEAEDASFPTQMSLF